MSGHVITKGVLWAFALGLTLAGTLQVTHAAEQVQFYHTDAAGTPVAMTDAGGNVIWKQSQQPFGVPQSTTGTVTNPLGIAGKPVDPETGLVDLGARWYSPKLGRFLQVDPALRGGTPDRVLLEPQRLNPYSYGLNNPYSYVEVAGRFSIPVHRQITLETLPRLGFSERAARRVAEGNVSVDALTNLFNNYQHAMRDVGESREQAVIRANQFVQEKLQEAARLIAGGDYEAGLFVLGQGLHTVQDRKHKETTLIGHLNPQEVRTDFKPPEHLKQEGIANTENYLNQFWNVLQNEMKVTPEHKLAIQNDLRTY